MPGILVEIIGNATQFKKELDSAVIATNKANTGFARMQKAAGIAGLALVGGLAIGLDKSVHAAMQAEQQTARLNEAFKASGENIDTYQGAIEEAEKSSRKLGFTNADVRQSLGSLEIATHDGKEAIKELSVAQDLARFKGMDLATATKALTMAAAGSQRAIKQLGLSITPTNANLTALKDRYKALHQEIPPALEEQAKFADKQQTLQDVIALVTQKMHGQAKAFADTAQGGAAQFHAQIDALEESLGKGLLPALTTVAGALATVAAFFAEHTTTSKVLVGALAALAAVLLTVSVATKTVAAAVKIWTAAQWLLNVALDANPIGAVIVAIGALVAAFILAWKHSETFRHIVTGAFDAVSAAANAVLDFFRDHWKIIAILISGPFAPIVALATDAFGVRSALIGAVEAIVDKFRWFVGISEAIWKGVYNAIATPVKAAIAVIQELISVVEAAANAVQNLIDKIPHIHIPHIGVPHVPFRAAGGPVKSGNPYIVGEHGKELFVPGVSGSIIPNDKLGGSFGAAAVAGGGMNITVNLPNYLGAPRDVAEEIRRELIKLGKRNGGNVLGGLG